jgi:hypothetical protein
VGEDERRRARRRLADVIKVASRALEGCSFKFYLDNIITTLAYIFISVIFR